MLYGHGPYSSREIRILLSTKIFIFPSNVYRFQISIIGRFLIISISNSLEKKLSVDPSGGLCEARVDNHSSLFTHLSNKVYQVCLQLVMVTQSIHALPLNHQSSALPQAGTPSVDFHSFPLQEQHQSLRCGDTLACSGRLREVAVFILAASLLPSTRSSGHFLLDSLVPKCAVKNNKQAAKINHAMFFPPRFKGCHFIMLLSSSQADKGSETKRVQKAIRPSASFHLHAKTHRPVCILLSVAFGK